MTHHQSSNPVSRRAFFLAAAATASSAAFLFPAPRLSADTEIISVTARQTSTSDPITIGNPDLQYTTLVTTPSINQNGGAVAAYTELTLQGNVTFEGNKITGSVSGGAISFINSVTTASTLNLTNAGDIIFRGNSAGTNSASNGGAIDSYNGALTITASNVSGKLLFDNNVVAGGFGGAIYQRSGPLIIQGNYDGGIEFTNNSVGASGYGGAIGGAQDNTSSVTINAASSGGKLVLNHNTAGYGGAIYAFGNGVPITIAGTYAGGIEIIGNIAGNKGGAIYSFGNPTTITANSNITISDNIAKDTGGAFCMNYGDSITLNLAEGKTLTATGNSAGSATFGSGKDASGGFLYLKGGDAIFNIGTNAVATIGNEFSVANHADSIAGEGGSRVTKTGPGTLNFWANNSYLSGTTVSAGTLNIRNGTTQGATVTISGASAEDAATLAVIGTGILAPTNTSNLINGSSTTGYGTLIIQPTTNASGVFLTGDSNVNGKYTQNEKSTLEVTLQPGRSSSSPYLSARSASLAGTLVVSGYEGVFSEVPKASGIPSAKQLIIRTALNSGITGNFKTIVGASANGDPMPDYVTLSGVGIENNGKDYVIGFMLAWNAAGAQSHGTFTLPKSTDVFELDVTLGVKSANTGHGEGIPDWDGGSLNKQGAGKLIISAASTLGGTYSQNAGTVQLGTASKGNVTFTSASVEVESSTLDLVNNATLAASSGEFVVTGTVDARGLVTGMGALRAAGGMLRAEEYSTISPAGPAAIGTITIDAATVTLAAGWKYVVNIDSGAGEVSPVAGVANDLIVINSGGVITVNEIALEVLVANGVELTGNEVFTIISANGAIIGTPAEYLNSTAYVQASNGWTFEVALSGDGQSIVLKNGVLGEPPPGGGGGGGGRGGDGTVVPEPSTYGFLGGVVVLGFALWRRRRGRAANVK